MNANSSVWLAAYYHLPLSYTCRVPLTSPYSAKALPGPSPATVRLALIRNSIELFGTVFTREQIFPVLRNASLSVRPPARVAISSTMLRFYKATDKGRLIETIGYQEVAQAEGTLTVYLQTPIALQDKFTAILSAVGYWGQANSFAYCYDVSLSAPDKGTCAVRLDRVNTKQYISNYFTAFATEFRNSVITWDEIVASTLVSKSTAIQQTIYIWPLIPQEYLSTGAVYVYCALEQNDLL